MFHSPRSLLLGSCSFVVITASLGSAWASDSTRNEWKFTVTPYIWFVGMDGEVGVAGRRVSVNDSFIDIMEDSDSVLAFMGDFGASKGPWTFFVSPTWAKLGQDNERIGPFRADVTETITIIGFGAKYRLAKYSLAQAPGGSPEWANQFVTFDLIAGGRYTRISAEVDFRGGPSPDKTKDWADPFVGGVTQVDLSDKLTTRVRADIGGFGAGSDDSWQAIGLIGYKVRPFGLDGILTAGYRALHQDYEDGKGLRKFEWDMTLHGPVLGLAVTF